MEKDAKGTYQGRSFHMCSYKAMKLLVPRVRPCMCMRAGNLQLSRSEEHSCTLKTLQEKCTQYQKTKMLRSRPKFMRKHFWWTSKLRRWWRNQLISPWNFHSTFSQQGFAEHLEEFQVATGWWNQTGLEMVGCIGQIIFITHDLISLALTKCVSLGSWKINSNFFA